MHARAVIFARMAPIELFLPFSSLGHLEFNSMMEVRFKNVFRAVASGNFSQGKEILEL